MRARRFAITNHEELKMEREVLPVLHQIVRGLGARGEVERIVRLDAAVGDDGWVVFKGEGDLGFAINWDGEGEQPSLLQRSVRFVRLAHAVVEGCGGYRSFPFVLTLERTPPATWSAWRVEGDFRSIVFASSNPVARVSLRERGATRDPPVRVRAIGVVDGVSVSEQGARLELETIRVWIPEIGVRARGIVRGGAMMIEIEACDDVERQQIPGVRLDLGEIEMRLSDLVGLKPGAVINLGEVTLERCFVRLGATVLAEGRFQTADGSLLLTIDSVL